MVDAASTNLLDRTDQPSDESYHHEPDHNREIRQHQALSSVRPAGASRTLCS